MKGKEFKNKNKKHCGSEGHWLEKKMGIIPNATVGPDKLGYEQKKESKKITFFDLRSSLYIFEKKEYKLTKSSFLRIFGESNPKQNNRLSWSGTVFPKYGLEYNYAGQRIRFLENENLVIEYSFSDDKRERKEKFPDKFKSDKPIELAIWTKQKLEEHILKKFGIKDSIFVKNEKNKYDKFVLEKIKF